MRNLILGLFLILTAVNYGQAIDTIYVGFNKSAWLMFDDPVTFDAGSQDIIVRNPDTKIILQAGVEGFEETNLLVQCGNEMFIFIVRYAENPKQNFYNFQKKTRSVLIGNNDDNKKNVSDTSSVVNTSQFIDHSKKDKLDEEIKIKDSIASYYDKTCEKALSLGQEIYNRGGVLGKMMVYLESAHIYNDEYYFVISIKNKTNISYEMDYLGFFVRDLKNKIKGVSIQDIQIEPRYIYNDVNVIPGKEVVRYVYVFDKFVLDNGKKFNIEAWEDNGDLTDEGGRKMSFSLYQKEILNIKNLE